MLDPAELSNEVAESQVPEARTTARDPSRIRARSTHPLSWNEATIGPKKGSGDRNHGVVKADLSGSFLFEEVSNEAVKKTMKPYKYGCNRVELWGL